MATQLENNTSTLETLIDAINALPEGITIDTTLTQSGEAADAKVVGDRLATIDYPVDSVNGKTGAVTLAASDVGAAASSHSQAASTISTGTFAGAVTAQRNSQTYSSYLLRNSRLSTSATNPSYNGEICWTYE